MPLATRQYLFAGALLLLGACAHQPAKPPEREPIVAPAAPIPPQPAVAPPDATVATPSLTMPREWQHHNGEDYDDLFDRMRAGFTFDEVQEPAIDQQLAWCEHNPDYLERVFQRGQRYMYHVVTEVEARGMPLEFALLPVVESAYEPFAYSVSRAAGLWQFIPDTGRRFGLKQNWWFDGRRDVIESTRAALDYLQALHDQFAGDWLLAIAAQLAGTSYDELVALNPGYNRWATDPDGPHRMLVPIDNADGLETALQTLSPDDRVRFALHEVTRRETLASIAKAYGTSVAVIAKINDLKGGKVSAGESLKIPEISGQLPDKVLLAASRVDRPDLGGRRQRQIVYRVRAGETLSSIARRHGMPVSTLARLNNMGAGDTLVKGQRLVIKASARRYRDEGVSPGRRVLYTVRSGDTVYSISKQFQVSVPQLKTWNGLNRHHQIRAGQRLVMYVDSGRQQG